jgi:hypothetical protein
MKEMYNIGGIRLPGGAFVPIVPMTISGCLWFFAGTFPVQATPKYWSNMSPFSKAVL